MGTPYGQYLLDDVTAGRVKAKMHVLLTAWRLTPAQREQLLRATRGSLRVWCYAPGYDDGQQTSLEAMSALTGFKMKRLADTAAWAEPTPAGAALGLKEAFGVKKPISPLFAAADATAEETLATYPDGSAAVRCARRRTARRCSSARRGSPASYSEPPPERPACICSPRPTATCTPTGRTRHCTPRATARSRGQRPRARSSTC